MSDEEVGKKVAAHDVAINDLRTDVSEIKQDLKHILNEALKRWPQGLAVAVTVLCSGVTGLAVYLLTH